jgi:sugar/nucleoside kinase (ribokinase family)
VKSNEAVVLGCAGIDTNIYLYGGEVDFTVEANFAHVADGLGQAGCYSARAFRALGWRTALIAALGEDGPGAMLRQGMAAEGIELLELKDPGGTHRSVNVMYRDGRRKNFYDGKRGSEVQVDLERCRLALVGARVVHCHLDDWCRRLLPVVRELGVLLSVDLQDVVDPRDPYRADFVHEADILFFSGVNHPSPEPVARDLLARGRAKVAVVGRGSDGCMVVERDGPATALPVRQLAEPVVDTNGAGDALAVGFLHAHLLDGEGYLEAAQRGQLAARIVCTAKGDAKRFASAEALRR